MRIMLTISLLAAILVIPATAGAADGPYRTDAQAEQYLETSLSQWAGINLHPPANTPDEDGYTWNTPTPSASCSNGAYSRHEARTRRHYRERIDRNGEARFRSFACELTAYADSDGNGRVTFIDDDHKFRLYLQTRPHGPWVIMADR